MHTIGKKPFRIGLAVLSSFLLLPSADASILSVSGPMSLIGAPASAQQEALTSATVGFAWDEQQNYTLLNNLAYDAVNNTGLNALYDANGDLNAGTISSGTVISSHYVHFDNPGTALVTWTDCVITFDADIIGVIVIGDNTSNLSGKLDSSDYLGSVGTLYPNQLGQRGLELGGSESFTISGNKRTLTINITQVSTVIDTVRIITAQSPQSVPEPATVALATAAVGLGVRRMRRRRQGA